MHVALSVAQVAVRPNALLLRLNHPRNRRREKRLPCAKVKRASKKIKTLKSVAKQNRLCAKLAPAHPSVAHHNLNRNSAQAQRSAQRQTRTARVVPRRSVTGTRRRAAKEPPSGAPRTHHSANVQLRGRVCARGRQSKRGSLLPLR